MINSLPVILAILSILMVSGTAYGDATARVPVSVTITTPALEMSYQEALEYCQTNIDDQGCDIVEDMKTIEDLELEDGFIMFEYLQDEGMIE